ncbi:MAG: hypothetical protein QXD27_07755 [Metallosphaera sp.]
MNRYLTLVLLVIITVANAPIMVSNTFLSFSNEAVFQVIASWGNVPSLNNLTTIKINIASFINLTKLKAYALFVNVKLPYGITNFTGGQNVQLFFPLVSNGYVQQFSGLLQVKLNTTNLSSVLFFPVSIIIYSLNGTEQYSTYFTLNYYGIPNLNVTVLNNTLAHGYDNITFTIQNNNVTEYDLVVSSNVFGPININKLNPNENLVIHRLIFVPFNLNFINLVINVKYITPYGIPNFQSFYQEAIVNSLKELSFSISVVGSPQNSLYLGNNLINLSVIDNNINILNKTIFFIFIHDHEPISLSVTHLLKNQSFSKLIYVDANSPLTLSIYLYFISPLGPENVSLGTYFLNFTDVTPISVNITSSFVTIKNNIGTQIMNLTLTLPNDRSYYVPLLRDLTRINASDLNLSTLSLNALGNASYYVNGIRFNQTVPVLVTKKLSYQPEINVTYNIINVTVNNNKVSGVVLLGIKNLGNLSALNLNVIALPNGTSISPEFITISQLLPNETVTYPIEVQGNYNYKVTFLVTYYFNNHTINKNILINFDFYHPLLSQMVLNNIQDIFSYSLFQIPLWFIAILVVFVMLLTVPSVKRNKNNK